MRVERVLDEDAFQGLALYVRGLAESFAGTPYHDLHMDDAHRAGRWVRRGDPFVDEVHAHLHPRVERLARTRLKRTYSFVSLYGPGTTLPMHHDRPSECGYTLNLLVEEASPWPLVIGEESFLLAPNEGVLFRGADVSHGRPTPGPSHAWLVLFHFIDP